MILRVQFQTYAEEDHWKEDVRTEGIRIPATATNAGNSSLSLSKWVATRGSHC